MKITQVESFKQSVTLRHPFKISFATIYELQTIIVKVTTDTGVVGFGEASPFEPVTGESIATELVALDALGAALVGVDPRALERVHNVMDATMLGHTAAKAGIDIACYDILGKDSGLPLYQLLGGDSNQVVSDYTLGIDTPEAMASAAQEQVAAGFTVLKVKVGDDDQQDIAAIRAIRAAVGPDVELRIDANQAWTPKQAKRVMRAMGDDVAAVEQPLPASQTQDLPLVRALVDQPVMVDESVHSATDAFKVLAAGGADIVNIKLQKAGGLWGATQINAVAAAAGIPVMLGCMVETKVGIAAAVHFVAAHQNARYADLDAFLDFASPSWLHGGFTHVGGIYTLSDAPGLGIECDL
ncbi:mandelate racemase/muconate lactonizing enzyme family protein [Lacticaseibacillus thailandensis]|uniref:Dipeptide epimerase n=1 Tax=Lacticaseibacillus thailandensis DSM 22698 = JCM 13996 TaxID=1423810 RepID=A0A0R2C7X8_9LACO|nr:dipeptide epimerase [Lacticaseibacillus thailandensis]KRM87889.1 l-alanine-Dl-glutamate epimerase-like protein [Lacticaseibacillus thailandensis DSM 22698 = JCM 13996]